MTQSRTHAMSEAVANVILGYGLAVALQLLLFPAIGLQISVLQSMKIGVLFTVVSLLRSYVLRRLFNRLGG